MNVEEDLGKAATRSLDESGLFRRTYFTMGGETKEADLILRGTVRQTTYRGKVYSYGLSIEGPLLWLFGLPAGSSTDTLEFNLSLKDQAGGEVWSYSYLGDESIIQGLYYNNGDDTINFAALMETGMNKGLQDLASMLPQIVQDLGVRVTPTTP